MMKIEIFMISIVLLFITSIQGQSIKLNSEITDLYYDENSQIEEIKKSFPDIIYSNKVNRYSDQEGNIISFEMKFEKDKNGLIGGKYSEYEMAWGLNNELIYTAKINKIKITGIYLSMRDSVVKIEENCDGSICKKQIFRKPAKGKMITYNVE